MTSWQQESLRMRVVPTSTLAFPYIFLRSVYRCREEMKMVHCELLIPSAQNKRSTGGRYNKG